MRFESEPRKQLDHDPMPTELKRRRYVMMGNDVWPHKVVPLFPRGLLRQYKNVNTGPHPGT